MLGGRPFTRIVRLLLHGLLQLLLVCWLCLASAPAVAASAAAGFETCIVGAGPGGIQLGHLLLGAGRSFRVYERNAEVASFFRRYPVHRKLISVNQRYTGSTDPEFNMRHDWNSLLGNDRVPKVTERTREKWPDADVVADYMRDFAQAQVDAGHIAFNTTVSNVRRSAATGRFELEVVEPNGAAGVVACEDVVIATGASIANELELGEEFVHGYEDLPPVEEFEGKHVAVLGNGNAAFETIEWLGSHGGSYVTSMARARLLGWKGFPKDLPASGTRFAMLTHYVGDVRAGRLGIFDGYQLKMRDRISREPPADADGQSSGVSFAVMRCHGSRKLCIWPRTTAEARKPVVLGFEPRHHDALRAALDEYRVRKPKAAKRVKIYVASDVDNNERERRMWPKLSESLKTHGVPSSRFDAAFVVLEFPMMVMLKDAHFLDFFRRRVNVTVGQDPFDLEGHAHVSEYDAVVRCFGWRWNAQLLSPELRVKSLHGGKFPEIDGDFRARSGVHFAGALAHSLDYRISAGGFIHGYRYTARPSSLVVGCTRIKPRSWLHGAHGHLVVGCRRFLIGVCPCPLPRSDRGALPAARAAPPWRTLARRGAVVAVARQARRSACVSAMCADLSSVDPTVTLDWDPMQFLRIRCWSVLTKAHTLTG